MNLSNLTQTILQDLHCTYGMENAAVHHPKGSTTTTQGEHTTHWRHIRDRRFSAHFSLEPRDRALCVDVIADEGVEGAVVRIYFAGEEIALLEWVSTREEWATLAAHRLAKLADKV